jgi:hypothetical protein
MIPEIAAGSDDNAVSREKVGCEDNACLHHQFGLGRSSPGHVGASRDPILPGADGFGAGGDDNHVGPAGSSRI